MRVLRPCIRVTTFGGETEAGQGCRSGTQKNRYGYGIELFVLALAGLAWSARAEICSLIHASPEVLHRESRGWPGGGASGREFHSRSAPVGHAPFGLWALNTQTHPVPRMWPERSWAEFGIGLL